MRTSLLITLAMLLPLGCFDPQYGDGAYACSSTSDCPGGLECLPQGAGGKNICVPGSTGIKVLPDPPVTMDSYKIGAPQRPSLAPGLGNELMAVYTTGGTLTPLNREIGASKLKINSKGVSAGLMTKVNAHTADQSAPVISFDGNKHYLVVWSDKRNTGSALDLYAALVDVDGKPASGFTEKKLISAANNQSSPSVARSNSGWLVTWDDERVASKKWDIRGVMLDNNLKPIREDFAICSNEHPQALSRVAYANGSFQVVWQDTRNGLGKGYDLYGARLDSTGKLKSDPEGELIISRDKSQAFPDIAFDGTNWVLVWQDDRNKKDTGGGTGLDLYMARLDHIQGKPKAGDADGVKVYVGPQDQRNPAVACNRKAGKCLVAWTDRRDNTKNDHGDIYATRVDVNSFKVLDPKGVPLIKSTKWHDFVGVASQGAGFVAAWSTFVFINSGMVEAALVVP